MQLQLQAHLENVANLLVNLNADIVVIPETQNCAVLDSLLAINNSIATMGYKPYLIYGTDVATGQNVGLITRIDPVTDLRRTEATGTTPPGSTCITGYNPSDKILITG